MTTRMQQSVQTIRVKHDPISVHMQSAPRSGTIADCLTLTGAASSCSFFFCFFPFWPFPWPPLALSVKQASISFFIFALQHCTHIPKIKSVFNVWNFFRPFSFRVWVVSFLQSVCSTHVLDMLKICIICVLFLYFNGMACNFLAHSRKKRLLPASKLSPILPCKQWGQKN